MADRRPTRANRRAALKRRRRTRRLLIAGAAIGAALLAAIALLLLRPKADPPAPAAPAPAVTGLSPAKKIPLEPVSTASPSPTPSPTPVPTPTPVPAPTIVPGTIPDVVSFYTPKGKNYSPRVRMGDTFTAPWKKGKDIGSFEVIASNDELLDGSFFGDIFGAAWKRWPNADLCRIGYTLRYTLDDGTEIRFSMLSPNHIEHTEYIECWLYDDYHREPHKFYSHLKGSSMKSDTLITSIKLTAGRQIARVTDIWLTAFICTSLDDFDEDRNYIGNTSCTIHILKK